MGSSVAAAEDSDGKSVFDEEDTPVVDAVGSPPAALTDQAGLLTGGARRGNTEIEVLAKSWMLVGAVVGVSAGPEGAVLRSFALRLQPPSGPDVTT